MSPLALFARYPGLAVHGGGGGGGDFLRKQGLNEESNNQTHELLPYLPALMTFLDVSTSDGVVPCRAVPSGHWNCKWSTLVFLSVQCRPKQTWLGFLGAVGAVLRYSPKGSVLKRDTSGGIDWKRRKERVFFFSAFVADVFYYPVAGA